MNAFGISLLVVLAGQLSPGPAGSSQPRDFGWQLDEQGVLEYIVQIAPTKAAKMQQRTREAPFGQDFVSDMPPELVGRVTRIVIRIGDSILPREPSLSEISRLPLVNHRDSVTAALGQGRLSDVEPQSVVDVQGGALPEFSGSGPVGGAFPDLQQQRGSAGGNVVDQVRGSSGAPPAGAGGGPLSLADRFLQGAGDQQLPATGSQLPGFPTTGRPAPTEGSKFQSTAPINATPGTSNPGLPGFAGNPPPTEYTPGLGGARKNDLVNQGWQSTPPQDRSLVQPGYGYPQDYATAPSNPATTPGSGIPSATTPPSLRDDIGIADRRSPVPTFGSTPRQPTFPSTLPPGSAQGLPGYASAPPQGQPAQGQMQPGQPAYPAGGSDPVARLAANTPAGPAVGGAANGTGEQPSLSDADRRDAAQAAARSNSSQSILQVFFLLSLVVNLYLAMLIRKLMTRYRSLLSSVRGNGSISDGLSAY